MFTPRPYQAECIECNVEFFKSKKKRGNAINVLPTAAGKSIIIANTAQQLEGNTLVLQPNLEILQQNVAKYMAYGFRAGVYSASANMKFRDQVTFATIGSIKSKHDIFDNYRNLIIDECHLVNPEEGMYRDFIKALPNRLVLGLSATPYRLKSTMDGSELRFITRQSPRIFSDLIYYVQPGDMFREGYLAPLQYWDYETIDRSKLVLNSTGTDYTEASRKRLYDAINMPEKVIHYANRLLAKRKNLLVFCAMISEANQVAKNIEGAVALHGGVKNEDRQKIVSRFLRGEIRCLVVVDMLGIGFDFPGLECILIGRDTLSLARYLQWLGRVMRPFQYPDGTWKKGWVVDLGGNVSRFGKAEDMRLDYDEDGQWCITNNGRQLTNRPLVDISDRKPNNFRKQQKNFYSQSRYRY